MNSSGPELALHICCAPCSTAVVERLLEFYRVVGVFYNPNIYPYIEYSKRFKELKRVNSRFKFSYIEVPYDHEYWLEQIDGLESEPEGGGRCKKCFAVRMRKTAEFAENKGIPLFTTTMSVSPYKNAKILNSIGQKISGEFKPDYLDSDFKKKDGYRRSILLSKELRLYRQNYCGCEFSSR